MKLHLSIRFLLVIVIFLVAGGIGAQDSAGGELTILLASPGEGETFYASAGGFILAVPITGQVVSYDAPFDPTTVEVTLDFITEMGEHLEITTGIDDERRFEIWASIISSDQPFPSDDPHDEEDCSICHRWSVDMIMPEKIAQLVVSARAENGFTGHLTRNLRLDRGFYRDLVVNVEGIPANTDAQISAATFIYGWRQRTFLGKVADSSAVLPVEGLTYGDLNYEVSLVPHIVDETLYTSRPEYVIVPGGEEHPPSVTLHAQANLGSITGQVVDGISDNGVEATLMAVNLVSGATQTTTTANDGTFVFENLPVAEHALLAQAPGGFHLPQRVDLTETIAMETSIQLTQAGTRLLRGRVTLDGAPLPFAQVVVDGLPTAHVNPISGYFELDAVTATEAITIEVTAAGCYGIRRDTTEHDLGDITLSLHEDTEVIKEGGSRLYIPAQSTASVEDGIVDLQNGVLWVQQVDSSEGISPQILVDGYVLEGSNASFAIEHVANARARLYVSDGQVVVRGGELVEPVMVTTGQTLVLTGESSNPVDLVAGSGVLLRSIAGSVTHFAAAPSTADQLSDTMTQMAVIVAQISMLIAYAITYVALPGIMLVAAIAYVFRRRNLNTN
jgi:hypothetical protein